MSRVLSRCAFCILFLTSGVFAAEEEEDSVSVQDNETLNFVLATDINYAVPTAVVIHSIFKSVSGPKSVYVIVDDYVQAEQSKIEGQLKSLLGQECSVTCVPLTSLVKSVPWLCQDFSGVVKKMPVLRSLRRIIPVGKDNIFDAITQLFYDHLDEKRKGSGGISIARLMAIRIFLPQILDGSSEYKKPLKLDHFLWLDSDLIVTEDLRRFYYDYLISKSQPLFSANHRYIVRYPDIPYTCDTEYKYTFKEARSGKLDTMEGAAGVSGGVVLWNLSEYKDSLTNWRDSISESTPIFLQMMSYLSKSRSAAFYTDESFFNEFLNAITDDNQSDEVEFFSTRYNCRSAYIDAAKQFLQDKTLKMSNAAREDLQAISEGRVAIWHWDYERKPWDYGSEETVGFPEALWWAYLRDLASKLDAEGLAIITSWRPNYQQCGLLSVSEVGLAISSNPRIPANGFL